MSMVCPSWLSCILYNPARKAFTDRRRIISESKISVKSVVLEVGAGNGFLTEVLAEHAAKVYAVELQEGMVKKLHRRVGRFGEKVSVVHGDIAAVVFEDGCVDVCILYYSFHEVQGKSLAARNIGRVVKPGGFVSIYEPTMEVTGKGMQSTAALFAQNGFVKESGHNGFFTRFLGMRKQSLSRL
jgi:ubiquinone/menaquinone biosynthesis C-methylase UbiE